MRLSGPDRKEVWEQLTKEFQGDMIEGGHWKGDRIEVRHGNWTLYLETDTVPTGDADITYTRMRAPFVSKDGLMFKIYKSTIFSNVGRILGMQDIVIGHDCFDDDFVIKGNNEQQIIRLFDNAIIRGLIAQQPRISLEITNTEGTSDTDDQNELYFSYDGTITDLDTLKGLFDLFTEVLDEMVRIGSAYNKAPSIDLYKDEA